MGAQLGVVLSCTLSLVSPGGFLGAARACQEKHCWFLTRTVGEQNTHPVCGVSSATQSHLVNLATRK